MSEEVEKVYPQMPLWQNMLSPELLLIYVAQSMGEFTVDKDNKQITMSVPYNYDSEWAQNWLNMIEDFEAQYITNCENQKGAPNDLSLFKEFRILIQELQQRSL